MERTAPAPMVIRGREWRFGQRTFVMGIVNVTPDSFSGDGLLARSEAPLEAAVAQAVSMVAEGADVIDVGGESTRPGHDTVSSDEELDRVRDVIRGLRARVPMLPISIDTSKAEVAEAALTAGADIVNDVTAVTSGAALAAVAAAHGAPYILMHGRTRPEYTDLIAEVVGDLRRSMAMAIAAGCEPNSLMVDPGIGFGKTAEQNLALLRGLPALRALGRPVVLGTSRKSTIGKVLGSPVEDRLEGTLATTALGIAAGIDMVRVHDVWANVRAARMADAIIRGNWHDDSAASVPTDQDPDPHQRR